jgi:hypothetical protein
MFGVFMSNNIIVPVHLLSHIHESHDEHEESLVSCDVFHTAYLVAITSNTYSAFLPQFKHSDNEQSNTLFVHPYSVSSKYIRAPPFHA